MSIGVLAWQLLAGALISGIGLIVFIVGIKLILGAIS